jgi:hypothetical protein
MSGKRTMLAINSEWNGHKTFRLIPVSNDCPYVECIYDVTSQLFVIISKTTKTTLHMLPKLDENGDPTATVALRPNGRNVKEERVSSETFQEYYLDNKSDIKELVYYLASNAEEFDIESILEIPAPAVK